MCGLGGTKTYIKIISYNLGLCQLKTSPWVSRAPSGSTAWGQPPTDHLKASLHNSCFLTTLENYLWDGIKNPLEFKKLS